MDPARKRRVRLVVALTAAVLLAGALVWASFGEAEGAASPSRVLRDRSGRPYQMTGKVVTGSIRHEGEKVLFRVRDRNGTASVPVLYSGVVPDPFRDGREVIVSGHMSRGVFVGQRDSLVTKCPSKFQSKPSGKTI
ncbi:MAG: cytochrome c maturation protein CcmE [Actinobacteria bacterium]|nr:cytochrome c maturation protein CcmE [Actinomycetota bacterium]